MGHRGQLRGQVRGSQTSTRSSRVDTGRCLPAPVAPGGCGASVVARVLIVFGFTVSTSLGLHMLQSYVKPALSAAEATSFS